MKQVVQSLGIIMDGNRRWAVKKGFAKSEGHRAGLDTLIKCIGWCRDTDITDIAFYAFSTENWKRSKTEVDALMSLFEYMLSEKREDILKQEIRVRFVGDFKKIPKKIMNLAYDMEQETKRHTRTVWICLSYGGRAELAAAACNVSGNITESKLEKHLWTKDMPDLDMIIRTGGNRRLSNFLLWRAAYAELYFTKTMWPAFKKSDFTKALDWYEKNVEVHRGK